MNIFLALGLFVVALVILRPAGDWFVRGAVGLARLLRLPKMLVGIVIVGFSTTLPEFLVSVQAAWRGHPEIALGNAIGSVIADDGLALPLAALLAPVVMHRSTFRTAAIFLIAIDLAAYALAFDGRIGRLEGGLLVLLLAVYISYALWAARRGRAIAPMAMEAAPLPPPEGDERWPRILLHFSLGLGGVLLASHLIIESAIAIASFLGVPEVVIALTVVAVGTSLPEIVTALAAARRGEGSLAAGNIIGADILNILWIVGVSAAVNPIQVSPRIVNFSFPAMLVVVLTMLAFMRTGWQLDRREGIVLLGLYAVYFALLAVLFH